MLKNKNYLLPLIIAAALAVGIFIGGKLNFNDTPEKLFSTNSKKDKLNRLIDYIDYEYVDDVNTDSIVDVTVNNILNKLDPHSVYIPKREAAKVAENMKGDFVGVGVSFYMYKDSLAVIRPIEGGPSMKAGIRAGDRILMADNDTLYGKELSSREIVSKLKGDNKTSIKLLVYRPSEKKTLKIDLKRAEVPLQSVDAYYLLASDLGYIKINRFAESTYREFKSALNQLQKQGITKLALDLRDNPGGYLGIAEQIADEFLEDDKLILFTKNKSGAIEKAYASKRGNFEDGEIYVLINEKSASASEIVAGALQDNDRGTIIGRRSFGKGLVQREMGLGDGSSVRLTVSRYYTPTGRSIQRSYENGTEDYYKQFYKRYENGEMRSADSIKIADSLVFKTPKGKIVYGGGGIIPDIFVPINATQEEAWVNSMLDSGFMSFYVFEYLDMHRNTYNEISPNEFILNFVVNDEMVDDFMYYAEDRGLNIDLTPYKENLKLYIKATMAEQLYDENIQQQILKQNDAMLEAVLHVAEADEADVETAQYQETE
ncbi:MULTISPECIES: S41 family peptidase [Galbibacter]|uniref:S41 family peptidase n=1 Tax=Galbibacter pacificus TaxID=2996052 RepID=A0ABT6FTY4_9FLAO|nr:S41 family peptidase [Galbibacter pacificus]MDG3583224.1 S41 family peptidase [Galbibacter pacificus]MDG3586705.1 S41 family peptidase [Galbibacter pacificus]